MSEPSNKNQDDSYLNNNSSDDDDDSSYVPVDVSHDSSVDAMTNEYLDMSAEQTDSSVNAAAHMSTEVSQDDIVPDLTDKAVVDLSRDDSQTDNEDEEKKVDESSTENLLRSQASGSYLSMDAGGNVVQSFIIPPMKDDDDDDSIASAPRTNLPPVAATTQAVAASLLGAPAESNDDDAYEPASFETPPKHKEVEAKRKEIAKELSKEAVVNRKTKEVAKPKNGDVKVFKKKNSTNSAFEGKKEIITLSPVQDRQRKEEEAQAQAVLQMEAVTLPPSQLPPSHYSHLLDAYEFEQDPSMDAKAAAKRMMEQAAILHPPKDLVISPTDEHEQSPNTSYEDDIEAPAVVEEKEKEEPQPKGGLLSIFSPRDSGKQGKNHKHDLTPETAALSPQSNVAGDTRRQLFEDNIPQEAALHKKEFDATTVNRKRRRCYIMAIIFFAVLLGAAAAVIAYTMVLKQRQTEETNAEVVNIEPEGKDEEGMVVPDDASIVIAIANETDNSLEEDVNSGGFEWSGLKPVSPKTPTSSPSASPTGEPTITSAPTSKEPTLSPTTLEPSQAPVPTNMPTIEGDFVGRLQTLLQARDYRDSNDEVFAFDFSTNGQLNDPANEALGYLMREMAATQGIPEKGEFVATEPRVEEPTKEAEGSALGNVVVTTGGGPIPVATAPPTIDPDFYPIRLERYDDRKLIQRFALLSMKIAADRHLGGFSEAAAEEALREEAPAAVASKRIVVTVTPPNSEAAAPTMMDPSTLADPKDPSFLVDECEWPGVVCARLDNTTESGTIVTEIHWGYMDLDGSIAPTISLLKDNLVYLDMSNNNLVGSIPEELYEMTNLETIYLYKNALTGSISKSIGNLDKLIRFHLSHNALTGSIPTEFKSDGGSVDGIRPIEYFNVYSNQLTGSIPNDLRWRQCRHFDVGRNQLTGTLPEDIGEKFISLRHLFMDNNNFSGTFPPNYNTVGNGRLVALSLERNQLTGVIPGERTNWDTLVQWTMQENNFRRISQQNCANYHLVEYKADCDVCNCFGRNFDFCGFYCRGTSNGWAQGPGGNNN